MKQISQKNNFIYLFFSLIALLFSATVVTEIPGGFGKDLFSVVILLMLVISLKSLKTDTTWKWTAYTIIVSFVLLSLFSRFFDHDVAVYFILFTLLIFFIRVFIIAAKQVLFVGDIDGNKIIGSLTLYILLGLIWAMIYIIILAVDPSSFTGIEGTNWQNIFARVAYYSFVTLTTLGYGDVLPTNHIAEFFVYMEAIIGVFYMAIIVSSLISLHLSANVEKKKGQ